MENGFSEGFWQLTALLNIECHFPYQRFVCLSDLNCLTPSFNIFDHFDNYCNFYNDNTGLLLGPHSLKCQKWLCRKLPEIFSEHWYKGWCPILRSSKARRWSTRKFSATLKSAGGANHLIITICTKSLKAFAFYFLKSTVVLTFGWICIRNPLDIWSQTPLSRPSASLGPAVEIPTLYCKEP